MSKPITIILVMLSTLFWGTNFNIGKTVVEHLSPCTAAAIRFMLASLFIIPILFLNEKRAVIKDVVKRNLGIYILLGIVGIAGYNGLFFLGLKYTTPINGSLIMATNPLVTMLLAAFVLKDPIHSNQRIGVLFSLIGVIVVMTHGSLDILLHLKIALGDWIIMAANICWASYGVLSRRYLNQSTPLITTAATMVVGALVLILLAGYDMKIAELMHQSWQIYISLLYMAIFGSVLAYLFWNYGVSHLGAGGTAVFFNLVPMVTMLVAITLGQSITLIQIIGGLTVILGVLLSMNAIKYPGFKASAMLNYVLSSLKKAQG